MGDICLPKSLQTMKNEDYYAVLELPLFISNPFHYHP